VVHRGDGFVSRDSRSQEAAGGEQEDQEMTRWNASIQKGGRAIDDESEPGEKPEEDER
jgi:hypothetical protein